MQVPMSDHLSTELNTLVKYFKLQGSNEALQAAGLKRQVTELTLEVEELQKVHQKTKALLFGKSQEALGLYTRNNDLRIEVE